MKNQAVRSRKQARTGAGVRRGFTLIELLVVLVIIGILISLILVAAMDGVRRAEERATQALIIKLETAVNDRIEALLQEPITPQLGHYFLAWIYDGNQPLPDLTLPNFVTNAARFERRATVIAQTDFLKREMPDVFFVQNATGPYPLNFAANPFPTTFAVEYNYVLPIGSGSLWDSTTNAPFSSSGEGIYGASYHTAAGIYKNLGYMPTGYDSIDNDGNGLVDEYAEGIVGATSNQIALIQSNLAAHKHKTARSEMLYAILVEGRGPLGSLFNRDDFTDREVRDTDGDGLPEFVDAWGEPIQFYRWPLLYHSPIQRGQGYDVATNTFLTPYADMIDSREDNPLDLNKQLLAPSWWSSLINQYGSPAGYSAKASYGLSAGANAFEGFFHLLHEPMALSNSGISGLFWDRGAPGGAYSFRRAFNSKPLIMSWGPDRLPGVFGYYEELNLLSPTSADQLIRYENPAAQYDVLNQQSPSAGTAASQGTVDIQSYGQDDITNHTLQAGDGGS